MPSDRRHSWFAEFKAFFSSGVFFIVLGCAFLYASYETMFGTHSALTFVLVVVGVALILFGSGTQSMGEFEGGASQAYRAKIQLFGGAGATSMLIAMFFVYVSDGIERAFDVQGKYLEFLIRPGDKAGRPVPFDDLVTFVRLNGQDLPTFRRGDRFVVLIPYQKAFEGRRMLEVYFYATDPDTAEMIKNGVKNEIVVPFHALESIETADAGNTLVYKPAADEDDPGVIDILRSDDYKTISVLPDSGASDAAMSNAPIPFNPV